MCSAYSVRHSSITPSLPSAPSLLLCSLPVDDECTCQGYECSLLVEDYECSELAKDYDCCSRCDVCVQGDLPPSPLLSCTPSLPYFPSFAPPAACQYDVFTLYADSYGDGWDGAYYTWVDSHGIETIGTLYSGGSGTFSLCGGPGHCGDLSVSDGLYPSEISWHLVDTGVTLANGGAGDTAHVSCGELRLLAGYS